MIPGSGLALFTALNDTMDVNQANWPFWEIIFQKQSKVLKLKEFYAEKSRIIYRNGIEIL